MRMHGLLEIRRVVETPLKMVRRPMRPREVYVLQAHSMKHQ